MHRIREQALDFSLLVLILCSVVTVHRICLHGSFLSCVIIIFLQFCQVMKIPSFRFIGPAWGRGTPFPVFFPPLSIHFLIFCSFLLFPFSFSRSLYLFSSFVQPFPFYQNSHHPVSRPEDVGVDRSNLGLVCSVYFVLSLLLS